MTTFQPVSEVMARGRNAVMLYDAIRKVYPTVPHLALLFINGTLCRWVKPISKYFGQKVLKRNESGIPTLVRLQPGRIMELSWSEDKYCHLIEVRLRFEAKGGSIRAAGAVIAHAAGAYLYVTLVRGGTYRFVPCRMHELNYTIPVAVHKDLCKADWQRTIQTLV